MSTEKKLTPLQVREVAEGVLAAWLDGYPMVEEGETDGQVDLRQVQLRLMADGTWKADWPDTVSCTGELGTFRIRVLVAEADGQDELTKLLERANQYLQPCGSCDAGLPTTCTCAPGDPRAVLMDLVKLLGGR